MGGLSTTYEQFHRTLLSSINGNTYAYLIDPSLASSVPLVGVEDSLVTARIANTGVHGDLANAVQGVQDADNAHDAALTQLERDQIKSNPRVHAFGALFMSLYADVVAMVVVTDQELERRIRSLKELQPSWLIDPLEAMYRAMRARVNQNIARDRGSAMNLAERRQTGVHFVGLNHLRSTMMHLESLCLEEISAGRPTKPDSTRGVQQ